MNLMLQPFLVRSEVQIWTPLPHQCGHHAPRLSLFQHEDEKLWVRNCFGKRNQTTKKKRKQYRPVTCSEGVGTLLTASVSQ